MRFCDHCHNMLYLSVANDSLRYYCKGCAQSGDPNAGVVMEEGLEGTCVINNKHTDDFHTQYISKYIAYDPTLPRTSDISCVNSSCQRPPNKKPEVIYVLYDSENMKYIYYCCHCGTFWRTKQ